VTEFQDELNLKTQEEYIKVSLEKALNLWVWLYEKLGLSKDVSASDHFVQVLSMYIKSDNLLLMVCQRLNLKPQVKESMSELISNLEKFVDYKKRNINSQFLYQCDTYEEKVVILEVLQLFIDGFYKLQKNENFLANKKQLFLFQIALDAYYYENSLNFVFNEIDKQTDKQLHEIVYLTYKIIQFSGFAITASNESQNELAWKYLVNVSFFTGQTQSLYEFQNKPSELKVNAINAAKIRWEKDPKQTEKLFIKECWNDWSDDPRKYKSKAEFARDMLEKCENLSSQKIIEDWCREWEKAHHAS